MDAVLFSPVSDRDPCSRDPVYPDVYRDGALLHIVRKYRPKRAYLFLTERFWGFEQKDGRYSRMLRHVAPEIQIQFSRCPPGITNAALFDQFDGIFREQLEEIHRENRESALLVNVSSGTPQMQASLYLLAATLPFTVHPVQVLSPSKDSNAGRDFYNQALAEASLGEDGVVARQDAGGRAADFTEDRCRAVTCANAVRAVLEKNIQRLVENYDYAAARSLCRGSQELFSPRLPVLLEAALAHVNLLEGQGKAGDGFYEPAVRPLPREGRRCYDYLLYLGTLVAREAFSDYARAFSPALTTVMRMRLQRAGYDILRFCQRDQNGVVRLKNWRIRGEDPDFMEYLDGQYGGRFKDGPLSAIQMLHYMDYLTQAGRASLEVETFRLLRRAEETVRNLAAHEMRGITAKQIEDATGLSAAGLLEKLRAEYELANGLEGLCWDALKRLEAEILQELAVKPQ